MKKKSEQPADKFSVTGDKMDIEIYTKKRIKTLDDLLEECKVDTDIWEVERFTCNKWEVAAYNKFDHRFVLQDLWQVKAVLKRNKLNETYREIGKQIIAEIKKASPKVKRRAYQKYSDPCLCEMDFFDLHLGKLAWGKETGTDFDLKIAKSVFADALNRMMDRIKPFNVERFLFPVGNDLFNVNSSMMETYAGTPQSEDDRWKKTFVEGCRLMRWAIDTLSEVAPVDVIIVPGNHDTEAAFYAGEVLASIYANDANVKVDNRPPMRKYYRYGMNLIGFTHGKEEKVQELPLIMAVENGKDFAETKYREWHLGDKHHQKEYRWLSVDENKGVTVRLLRSLTATDNWHFQKGYIGSIRSGEAFLWNKSEGLVAHLAVNL